MSILEIKKLNKSYDNNSLSNYVLKDFNLVVFENDFVVIMGPSGAGKTTILNTISGIDKIDGGEIIYKNTDISKYDENKMSILRKNDFSFVFQTPNLIENMTLFENCIIAKSNKIENKYVDELLERFGLNDEKSKYPNQVSGGELARASIIRAISKKPKILFVDEPTGSLNKKQSENVLEMIKQINEEGTTIVMVTHDINAASYGNRVIYIEDGNVKDTMDFSEKDTREIKYNKINEILNKNRW